MTVKRMDNVGIVVENIDAAIEVFTELGLTLEGRCYQPLATGTSPLNSRDEVAMHWRAKPQFAAVGSCARGRLRWNAVIQYVILY